MSAQKELIIYRKMLRTARRALQRIRDYEPGAHMIARGALEEIEQTGFPYVGAEIDEGAEEIQQIDAENKQLRDAGACSLH